MGNEESSPEEEVNDHPLALSARQIKYIRKVWTKARSEDIYEPGARILLRVFERSPEIRKVFSFKEALRPLALPSSASSSSPTTRKSKWLNFSDRDKNKEKGTTNQAQQEGSSGSSGSPDSEDNNSTSVTSSKSDAKRHESMLKVHARKFSETIDELVKDLENLEAAGKMLKILGARHADIRRIGFQPKYWDVFAECIVEETITWGSTRFHIDVEESRVVWRKITLYLVDRLKSGYDMALIQKRTLL